MRITTSQQIYRAATCVAVWGLLSGAVSMVQAQSAADSSVPSQAPVVGAPVQSSLMLGGGDLIEVQVFDTPELSGKFRLDDKGFLALPLGGLVDLSGLTALQAGQAIESNLRSSGVMLSPHVSVFVDEYANQGITVLGEVKSTGTYTLYGPHSLYDALTAAGGPSATEGDTITIVHRNDPDHPVLVPVTTPNYAVVERTTQVQPGDLIVVSRAPIYYVIGDVGRPGAFSILNGEKVNILNAVALATGVNHTAKVSDAYIIRKTADGPPERIAVNIKQILENKQVDLTLQASDVLVIPRSGWKVFLDNALPSITNAGISAGASAAIIR